MQESKLRVAVLGAGAWANNAHIPGWQRDPRCEVVAICDPVGDRAAEFAARFNIPKAATDWEQVVHDPSIDVIDVCTPSATHFTLAWAGLEANKHVLCEKPVAYDYRETRAAGLARSKGLKTKLGFTFRYSPGVQYAKSLIDEGFTGRPFIFNGYEQNSQWLDPMTPLRQVDVDADQAVIQTSSLEGYGAPVIDISHWWVGADLQRVVGTMRNFIPERMVRQTNQMMRMNIDDGDIYIGEFANGALTSIQTSFVTIGNYPGIEARLYGEQGAIICRLVEEFGVAETIKIATPDGVEFKQVEIPQRFYPPGGHARESWRSLFYANLIRDFIDEILDGGGRNQGNFDDGAWVQETINAVERSFHEARWVQLPLEKGHTLNDDFQAWLARFFASYYRHRPVNATFMGEHRYDAQLPDFSAAGVQAALSDAAALLREAEAIDASTLSPVERIDKRLAEGFLRIQRWEFSSDHFGRGNPSLYTGEAIFSVASLFLTDYAPFAERAAAAIERMQALGELLDQGIQNVRQAPLAWTERALRECQGAKALFGRGIDILADSEPSLRPQLRAAADVALAAFARYERYLDAELRGAQRSEVACGAEVLDLLLREGHCLDRSADDILAYAVGKMDEAKARLAEQAAALGAGDWRQALAGLQDLHPTVDGYLRRYTELWESSRRLVAGADLLTWPDFPIEYVPQPQWAREAAPYLYFLFYRAPAAFNRPPVHRYLVTPIERNMPEAEQLRRLQATNDSVIKLNHVVHHGGVGHHVQNWNAYRGASQIGRVAAVDCASRIALFCGGTMAEGWACYATQLMAEHGFLTPLEELGETHGDLRMAARAVVDVRLHRGEVTLDEAARFYAEHTAMSTAAAHGEAVKNSMFPGAALMYLIGRDAILDLRGDLQRQLGSRFNLKQFHDRFLSFGSIPVALAADIMRQEAAA